MAKTDNLTDFLTNVADAIRAKKGTSDLINPQNFDSEIASISTANVTTKTITANGTYNATDDGVDGYSTVEVDVTGGGDGVKFEKITIGSFVVGIVLEKFVIPFSVSNVTINTNLEIAVQE